MSMENRLGKKVTLVCDCCGKTFLRPAITIRKNQKKIFCSKECTKVSEEQKKETRRKARKKWNDDNRDYVRQSAKKWRLKNPEKNKESKRKDWEKNRERYRAYSKENYKKNREEISRKRKESYPARAHEARARAKKWADDNREWVNERAKKYTETHKAKYMLGRAKKACREMGLECDMTEEWFQTRLDAGICEMSGLSFDMVGKRTPNSPSVDRIVAGGPYTMANCRMILWSLNRALCNYGEDHLIEIFKAIFKKRGIAC